MKSHAQTADSNDLQAHAPTINHNEEPQTITHNEEKITLALALTSGFAIWNMFR